MFSHSHHRQKDHNFEWPFEGLGLAEAAADSTWLVCDWAAAARWKEPSVSTARHDSFGVSAMIGIGQPLFISPLRPAQGEGLSATITYDAAQILRTDDTPSEMNLAPFSLH